MLSSSFPTPPSLASIYTAPPRPECSGLSFLYISKRLTALIFWEFQLGTSFPFFLLVVFIYQKAERNPNGRNIVKLDHPLKQAGVLAGLTFIAPGNRCTLCWESQATTWPLRAGALPWGSRRLP